MAASGGTAKITDFQNESDSPISSSASSESEGEFEYTDKKSVENYICCICHEIINEYVELPCDHIGCRRCISKWGETTYKKEKVYRCSECQQKYKKTDIQKSGYVDRLLKEKKDVFCKARDKGCEWVGSINDYTRYHQTRCKHRTMKCPFTGCRKRVLQSEMEEHKANCPQRLISCVLCRNSYVFSQEQLHINDCSEPCINEPCQNILKRNERV